jgi:hypothetical protein
MAQKEYLPLTDPNQINVGNKKQLHHLICKPCRPRYDKRQKANKNRTVIGGQAYNSDSGTHLLVGNESLRAVALETLSRRCSKCENNITHPDNIYSKNYKGSLKGMEAEEGALQNVRILFEDKDIIIETFVMDDDSSTCLAPLLATHGGCQNPGLS